MEKFLVLKSNFQSVLDTSKAENVDALDPKAVGDKKIKFLSKNLVSIDCEMVGVGFGGDKSVLARATIVAGNGDVLLDEFCSASEKVRNILQIVGIYQNS